MYTTGCVLVLKAEIAALENAVSLVTDLARLSSNCSICFFVISPLEVRSSVLSSGALVICPNHVCCSSPVCGCLSMQERMASGCSLQFCFSSSMVPLLLDYVSTRFQFKTEQFPYCFPTIYLHKYTLQRDATKGVITLIQNCHFHSVWIS